jgi:hypothetical protein
MNFERPSHSTSRDICGETRVNPDCGDIDSEQGSFHREKLAAQAQIPCFVSLVLGTANRHNNQFNHEYQRRGIKILVSASRM